MRGPEIRIGGRVVGEGHRCLVIAEAGVNHNGDVAIARKLVDAAADAGADVVKFQTWKTENVIGRFSPKAEYQYETTDPAESQFEMARRLELPFDAFRDLQGHAASRGIEFMSSPFDLPSVQLLDDMGVTAFKAGSGELTNALLLGAMAATGRPLIISTGMSTLEEVTEALGVIRAAGAADVAFLHCLSSYPAPVEDVNLRAMRTLASATGVPVGYSDHTLGTSIAIASVALGACILEKHLTVDRTLPGPDHRASLEPPEFKAMVRAIRDVESALGDGVKRPMPSEEDVRTIARRSVVASRDLPAGVVLGTADLAVKRPGTGLRSSEIPNLVGRRLVRSLAADELIAWKDVE